MVGHYATEVVLEFLGGEKLFDLARLGTSCPDHFLRTKVRPWCWTCRRRRPPRLPRDWARRLPRGLPGLYERYATPGLPAHARRRPGHRPGPGGGHALLRPGQADGAGGGRVLRQRHQRHAGRRGHLHLRPHCREREVPHSVLGTGRGQAGPPPGAAAPRRAHRFRDRRGQRHRSGRRRTPGRRGRLRGGGRPRRRRARAVAEAIGGGDVAVGVAVDVTDGASCKTRVDATLLAFGGVDPW